LAKLLGIDQGRYSRIERGDAPVDEKLLEKTADILDYPLAFFFESGDTLGLPISLHESGSYRKRQSLTQKILFGVESSIGIYISCLQKMISNVEIEFAKSIRPIDLDAFDYDIEHVAEQLRLQWGMPSGPVKNLTVVLENAGVLVVKHDFGTEKVDGFSIWPKNFRPIIFIRNDMPGDRERFTLAHELGHLLFHTDRISPDKEQEANRFASAFLTPEREITPYLKNLNLYKLQALKEEWRVSMAALAYRAKDLKTITENQYRYLCMELSRYRKQEPGYVMPESPTLIQDVVESHFSELAYTEQELCEFLCLNYRDFKKYFSFPKADATFLRLVQ